MFEKQDTSAKEEWGTTDKYCISEASYNHKNTNKKHVSFMFGIPISSKQQLLCMLTVDQCHKHA
jgi:hypothetical protein